MITRFAETHPTQGPKQCWYETTEGEKKDETI